MEQNESNKGTGTIIKSESNKLSEYLQLIPEEQFTEREKHLIEKVRELNPETLLSKENKELIKETVVNGLDIMAQAILEISEATGMPPEEIYVDFAWSFREFYRSILTNPPLPKQTMEYKKGEEINIDSVVADTIDWDFEIYYENKELLNSLNNLMMSEFGLDITTRPVRGKLNVNHEIFRSDKLITVQATDNAPETSFYPALIWVPPHEEDEHGTGHSFGCLPILLE